MIKDMIRTFYGYNVWANWRILDFTAKLSTEQYTAPNVASFSSVRDTLVHTMSAHSAWLMRFQKRHSHDPLNPVDYPDVATLRRAWEVVEGETQSFLVGLNEIMLAEVIHYTNWRGEPHAYPLWQMMMHQVNHGTQHRSEVAVILTEYGYSPGNMDLLVYLDTLKG